MLKGLCWKAVRASVLLLVTGVMLSPFVGSVRAEGEEKAEEKPTANVYVDVLSQYVFRGIAFSSDSAVIQPSFTASYKGFSINVWGNLDSNETKALGGTPDEASWNETDLTLSYTRTIYGDLSGTVGYIYYGTKHFTETQEGFIGLSYALPWFTVGVTGYREFWHAPGWWGQLDITRNFKLPWYEMNVDTALSLGYLERSNLDFAEFEAGQVSAALNIPIGKYLVISPKIGLAFPLSDGGSDDIIVNSVDHEDTHVFGGLRIAASF